MLCPLASLFLSFFVLFLSSFLPFFLSFSLFLSVCQSVFFVSLSLSACLLVCLDCVLACLCQPFLLCCVFSYVSLLCLFFASVSLYVPVCLLSIKERRLLSSTVLVCGAGLSAPQQLRSPFTPLCKLAQLSVDIPPEGGQQQKRIVHFGGGGGAVEKAQLVLLGDKTTIYL